MKRNSMIDIDLSFYLYDPLIIQSDFTRIDTRLIMIENEGEIERRSISSMNENQARREKRKENGDFDQWWTIVIE